jgi:hypothetical protein
MSNTENIFFLEPIGVMDAPLPTAVDPVEEKKAEKPQEEDPSTDAPKAEEDKGGVTLFVKNLSFKTGRQSILKS